ncbi:MAG: DUF5685 family protein [Acutalibacteraceae bacterium]
MFGYVKIYKPELKVKEYETYRGLYCSLCKTLGRQYGILSRLMLSYDVTFLVLVLLAVKSTQPDFKKGRCPFNLSKRCNYCTNGQDVFDYAAAVTIIMFYYKIQDNIADSGFFKKILMYLILPYASRKRKKACKRYAKLDEIVSCAMKEQAVTEKQNVNDFDKAAHHSADALGKIFDYGSETESSLYKFGYFVGRWIYLIDAADDLEKDLKSGGYNVFAQKYGLSKGDQLTDENHEDIRATLNMSLAGAAKAYNDLEITILFPIVENIIFDSMTNTMNNVLKGNFKNERSI